MVHHVRHQYFTVCHLLLGVVHGSSSASFFFRFAAPPDAPV